VTMPQPLQHAIETVAERWDGAVKPWLIGGSCGLLFHGVPIQSVPRDVDIYVDLDGAAEFHERLRPYTIDEPAYSETDKYRSTLSHYTVGGVTVELVAAFVVDVPDAVYQIDIAEGLAPYALHSKIRGTPVGIMPLAHEFVFNVLRERADRYTTIAAAMRLRPEEHMPALRGIISRNRFDDSRKLQFAALLQCGTDELAAAKEGYVCPK
jgi:hypothetical protein